jgi:hypothetical protein
LVDVEEASLRENFSFVALVFEDPEKWSLHFTGKNFGRLVNKAKEDVSGAGINGA